MKKCFTILVIIALTSCNQNKSAREIDKKSNLSGLTATSQDTIDVLNIYRLNIQEGNLDTIKTTWAEDARWLNAFGRVFIGRDTVISWLKYLYAMPGYAASSITRQDEPQIAFIRPDVAILHEHHEREGQILNAIITPTRKINTTYVLSKEKGIWLIRDKVTMDERGQPN